MALIGCSECGHQVSSAAPTCPSCGAPVAGASESRAAGTPLSTVQETSKKLKVHILISSIIFWVSLIWVIVAVNADKENPGASSGIAMLFLTVGIIWYVVARFRIWWHHK